MTDALVAIEKQGGWSSLMAYSLTTLGENFIRLLFTNGYIVRIQENYIVAETMFEKFHKFAEENLPGEFRRGYMATYLEERIRAYPEHVKKMTINEENHHSFGDIEYRFVLEWKLPYRTIEYSSFDKAKVEKVRDEWELWLNRPRLPKIEAVD